jgi:hypothetical protein
MDVCIHYQVMWFSSGDTKSVVHTDSAENINCLIAGFKTLVLVNPHLYSKKVNPGIYYFLFAFQVTCLFLVFLFIGLFIFVFLMQVAIDHPEGAYSGIDVDE